MGKKTISMERLVKDARRVLENPFWIPGLSDESYGIIPDDDDGNEERILSVTFLPHTGDVTISIGNHPPARFRDSFGGGKKLRVRNALMLLAWAIELDKKERLPG